MYVYCTQSITEADIHCISSFKKIIVYKCTDFMLIRNKVKECVEGKVKFPTSRYTAK